MTHPIDIFQLETAGVRWLEAAPDIERAKARVRELAGNSPGEYLVLNQRTGNKIVIKSDDVNEVDGTPFASHGTFEDATPQP
jgi:hypothetical protein